MEKLLLLPPQFLFVIIVKFVENFVKLPWSVMVAAF